jgi:hypothetical protein
MLALHLHRVCSGHARHRRDRRLKSFGLIVVKQASTQPFNNSCSDIAGP